MWEKGTSKWAALFPGLGCYKRVEKVDLLRMIILTYLCFLL